MAKLTKSFCVKLARIFKANDNLKGTIKDLSNHLYHSGLRYEDLTFSGTGYDSLATTFVWISTEQGGNFWTEMVLGDRIIPKFIP